MTSRRLLWTVPCLVALSACARCGGTNTAPPPAQLAAKTAQKEPEKAASRCRALVSVDGTKGYHALDVRIAEPSSVEAGRGLLVRAGKQTYALAHGEKTVTKSSAFGTGTATWDQLWIARIPGGKPELFMETALEVQVPEDDSTGSDFEQRAYISVSSVIGPYLSLSEGEQGYTGGAHEYSGTGQRIVRIPDKQEQGDKLLGKSEKRLLDEYMAAANAEREKSEEGLEAIDVPADLTAFELGIWQGDKGSLHMHSTLFCCSWAENHNMFDVDIELPSVPGGLSPYLTYSADEHHLITAPDGCGAIGLVNKQLVARNGKDGKIEPLPIKLTDVAQGGLLSVAWIDADDPFRISQLPSWEQVAPSASVQRLSDAERQTVLRSLPQGSGLAHELFRAPLLDDTSAVLVLYRTGDKLAGFALTESAPVLMHPLPPLYADEQGKLDEVTAILFDNLDADAAREPIVMMRLMTLSGEHVQHNVALDWSGSAFVRLAALEAKITGLTKAKQVRAALKSK